MRVSVVVPTCGRRDLSTRTLESLGAQAAAPPFEVVVVDDGADPGLSDHVASLRLPIDVTVVHHETNRGRSATRNTGIARAGGDVIVFLDGDMRVEPGFVAAHAAGHEGGDTVVLGDIRTAPELGRSAFVEYIDSRGVKKVAPAEAIPPRYFMTGNSSVARPLLERAGGFDEEFDEYGGEDTEMGYRLAERGGRFRHAKGAVSWHLDLNTVPRMAERLHRYGERMIPILVRKVPRAREDLRLDLAEPVARGDGPGLVLRKLAGRVLFRPLVWRAVARLGQALPAGVRADFLFDFVRAAAYLDGYGRAVRARREGGRG
jgi:glycosyltransferase involved in cell wall biosynthesis